MDIIDKILNVAWAVACSFAVIVIMVAAGVLMSV